MGESTSRVWKRQKDSLPSATVESVPSQPARPAWKILIADDEEAVHHVTRMVLSNFTLDDRPLKLLSAFSGSETQDMMRENSDIAMLLLDVMMENDNAGLDAVRHIREVLNNHFVRIVLRTGQAGIAPEQEVIRKYDINDYKAKTELTKERMFTTVTASLRAYRDIMLVEKSRKGLERIISASKSLFELQKLHQFLAVALDQTAQLLSTELEKAPSISGWAVSFQDNAWHILERYGPSAAGDLPEQLQRTLETAIDTRQVISLPPAFAVCLNTQRDPRIVLCLDGIPAITEIEERLANILLSNIATAVDNIYLNQEILSSYISTIFRLALASEMFDYDTYAHIIRISLISSKLAMYYGCDADFCEQIKYASMMHDVGKIGVPKELLNKAAKLTQEEFSEIKQHPVYGGVILRDPESPLIAMANDIAAGHHEKFNGTGYPQGLAGDAIPLAARIVAITDVFDALLSRRAYKEPFSMELAKQIIAEGSGEHFDPDLTRICLEHFAEFVAIRAGVADNNKELSLAEVDGMNG